RDRGVHPRAHPAAAGEPGRPAQLGPQARNRNLLNGRRRDQSTAPASLCRVSVPVPDGVQSPAAIPMKLEVRVLSPASVSVQLVIITGCEPKPGIGNVQVWFAAVVAVVPLALKVTVQ